MNKRRNSDKNENEYFKNFIEAIPDTTKNYVRLSMDIASQINALLEKENLSQRDLAERLGKRESEISKWLSGNHNFTVKSLAKIETVLEQQFLFTREEITDRFLPFLFRQFRHLYTDDHYKWIVSFYCMNEKADNNISIVLPFISEKSAEYEVAEKKSLDTTLVQTSTIMISNDNDTNRAA